MRHCVGCGFCCIKSVCALGQMWYGVEPTDRCPGLVWREDRYRCNLIEERPNDESLKIELAVGAGCCCGLNTWRRKVKKR